MRPSRWRRLARRVVSWQALAVVLGVFVGVRVDALMTDGPLTPLDILRGRTDENGYLRVLAAMPASATDGNLTPLGILRTRTDQNGYLRVSIAAGSNVAPADATYITQTANSQLTAEQALASLATGLMFNTTTTGVVSTVVCGTAGTVLIGGAPPTCTPNVVLTGGTITTSAPLLAGTQTWNASGVSFIGSTLTFTETASASTSRYFQILGGASGTSDEFYILKGGSTFSNSFTVSSTGAYNWANRSYIASGTDGNVLLSNSGSSGFSLLQFGGTTNSFPAIKRSSTTLTFRLADDSADAPITASNVSASGNYQVNGVLALSATAPTFTSGFGGATGRTITGSAAVFSIVVGSSSTDNNGVLGLPTATNGWVCRAENQTSPGATDIKQSVSTTSSVTLTQYNTTLGTAANFAASDIIKGTCIAY